MSFSEEYLDSLLAAINGQQNKEEQGSNKLSAKKIVVEELEAHEPIVAEASQEPAIEENAVTEPTAEAVVAEEPAEEIAAAPAAPDGDPNRALSPEEIAAMFAQAEAAAEPAVEEKTATEQTAEEPAAEESAAEEIAAAPAEPDGDPNRALSPDEIAAMFAQAETAEEPAIEEKTATEQTAEEPAAEESAAEEIAAAPAEPDGDPNRALSPEEIAAMFAQAETAEEPAIEEKTATEQTAEEPAAEESAAEEIAAAPELATENVIPDEETSGTESEALDTDEEEPLLPVEEEMEIDMDDEEAMSVLLGLKERPERAKKQNADVEGQEEEEQDEEEQDDDYSHSVSEEMDLEDILSDLGVDDPELKEIGDLLKKSDNHELVDEDVLALLEPDAFDGEASAPENIREVQVEEPEGNKRKKSKKKEKKGLLSFLRKKKDNGEEEKEESQEAQEESQGESDIADDETDFDSMLEMAAEQSEGPTDEMLFEAEESIDADDMQALLEGIPDKEEAAPKSKGKKKKKPEASDSVENADGQEGGEKKQSAIGRFFAMLLEEEEEDEEQQEGSEDKKEKKRRKGKKGKKGAVTDANDNEGILEELDAEEDGKKSKKKKEEKKKPKKEKAKKEPQEPEKPEKKLPVKMVVRIFILCFSVLAFLLIVANVLPQVISLSEARNAFYKQQYDVAYEEMTGRKLSKGDQRLYEKAKIIVKLQHKMEAFDNFKAMNKPVEALDSLLSGYALWGFMQNEIAEYDAGAETDTVKNQILDTLQSEYQLTEDDAITINELDDYHYTKRLEEITGALSMQNSNYDMQQGIGQDKAESEPEMPDESNATEDQGNEDQIMMPTEDVLPEEEIQ